MVFDTHNGILNHASQMLHIRMQLTDVAINPMETWNLYILQPFSPRSASELQKNLGEMFPRCYMDSNVINRSNYSITYCCVTRRERVNVCVVTHHKMSF